MFLLQREWHVTDELTSTIIPKLKKKQTCTRKHFVLKMEVKTMTNVVRVITCVVIMIKLTFNCYNGYLHWHPGMHHDM